MVKVMEGASNSFIQHKLRLTMCLLQKMTQVVDKKCFLTASKMRLPNHQVKV